MAGLPNCYVTVREIILLPIFHINIEGHGSSVVSPLHNQSSPDRPLHPKHSSVDSRRASCQLLAKEWALNTGKLLREACPRTVWLSD